MEVYKLINDLNENSMIGTDHAPHSLEEKTKGVWDSSPGIPSLETVLSLLLTEVNKSNLDLSLIPKIFSENAAKKECSHVFLSPGENISVHELLKAVAVASGNDAAVAMAEHIAGSESAFVDMMNAKAKELGMNDTHFVNCTGLDDGEDAASHKTSAHDIAIMSRELLKNHPKIKEFTTIWMDTIRNGQFGLSNTNKLIRLYPAATALKTGFTSAAGYCLGVDPALRRSARAGGSDRPYHLA